MHEFLLCMHVLLTNNFAAVKVKMKQTYMYKSISFFLFFFCLFKTGPMAHGSSQARGPIGTAAAGLHHSPWQSQILTPLTEARDRTASSCMRVRLSFPMVLAD